NVNVVQTCALPIYSSALATEMISNLRSSSVTCTSRRGDFSRFLNHLCVSWAFSCGRGTNRSAYSRRLFRATDNGLIYPNLHARFGRLHYQLLPAIPLWRNFWLSHDIYRASSLPS